MSDFEKIVTLGSQNEINYKSNNIEITNHITINESYFNNIISSLHSSDNQRAENILKALHRMIENSNLDPNWKYNINFDNGDLYITEEPVNEKATENLPKRMNVKFQIPKEYTGFNNLPEIIDYGRRKQVPIRFELLEFKNYIGDHMIDHVKSKFSGNLMLEIPPVPFPIVFMDIAIGEHLNIANVGMQIVEITDDNKIRINNMNQADKDIFIEFILDIEKHMVDEFNFRVPEEKYGNVKSILLWENVFMTAGKNVSMTVYSSGNIIMSGIINNATKDTGEANLRLLEVLRKIEEAFDIVFIVPEVISEGDINIISELIQIIEKGTISGTMEEKFEAKISDINGIIKYLEYEEAGHFVQFRQCIKNKTYSLLGKEISVGEEVTICPPMKIENPVNIKRKIEFFTEGDLLNVVFKPSDDNKSIIIYKNYSNIDERCYLKTDLVIEATAN